MPCKTQHSKTPSTWKLIFFSVIAMMTSSCSMAQGAVQGVSCQSLVSDGLGKVLNPDPPTHPAHTAHGTPAHPPPAHPQVMSRNVEFLSDHPNQNIFLITQIEIN